MTGLKLKTRDYQHEMSSLQKSIERKKDAGGMTIDVCYRRLRRRLVCPTPMRLSNV